MEPGKAPPGILSVARAIAGNKDLLASSIFEGAKGMVTTAKYAEFFKSASLLAQSIQQLVDTGMTEREAQQYIKEVLDMSLSLLGPEVG